MKLSDFLREQRDAKRKELDDLMASLEEKRTKGETVTDADTAPTTPLIADIEERNAAIASAVEAEARMEAAATASVEAGETRKETAAVVTREERTYTPEKAANGERSFFQDAYGAQRGNPAAQERLARNLQEAVVEGEISKRATTTASFAGLVVPQYLVDQAALVIRNGRPVANSVTGLPLPEQGMSLIIPRGTTGASAASQATENTSVSSTDEVWANLTVPVVTIAGQQDISRQSIERGTPGLDSLVYMDLAGAYHAELDRQVCYGSGASNQMLGIGLTASINAATLFGAAPTATTFQSKLAGQIAAVAGAGAGIRPGLIYVHPRRWGWLNSLVDSSGRPLVVPGQLGPNNAVGYNQDPGAYGGDGPNGLGTSGANIVGTLQGLPIISDANMPTAVGTESEDLVFVVDPSKQLLWEEGDKMPKQLEFEQTLGNQLTVKLVAYGYAAFTAGRYPQSVGKIGGLDTGGATFGLVNPTF